MVAVALWLSIAVVVVVVVGSVQGTHARARAPARTPLPSPPQSYPRRDVAMVRGCRISSYRWHGQQPRPSIVGNAWLAVLDGPRQELVRGRSSTTMGRPQRSTGVAPSALERVAGAWP